MTDEDEEKLREMLRKEMICIMLTNHWSRGFTEDEMNFCATFARKAPRAYRRIVKEVREELNFTEEREWEARRG